MTTIYLITNNCFANDNIIYKDYIDFDDKRRYRPLSVNGEKVALTIAKNKNLSKIDVMFSSSYFSSIDTVKYLKDKLDLDLIVDKRLDDRKVGNLTDSSLNLRNLQEHDFDYKLNGGESLNNVKRRMTSFVKEIIQNHEDSNIALFTHNISIISLLSVWCEKGFNYEEKLILNYNDEVIIDGLRNDYNIIKLEFEQDNLKNITRIV